MVQVSRRKKLLDDLPLSAISWGAKDMEKSRWPYGIHLFSSAEALICIIQIAGDKTELVREVGSDKQKGPHKTLGQRIE